MYKQVISQQRYTIQCLLQNKVSQNEIAKTIGVNPSTISRELTRNKGKRAEPITTDERADLHGSEVLFLMQDCYVNSTKPDGFTILIGGMEEHNYKWDGEKFIEE